MTLASARQESKGALTAEVMSVGERAGGIVGIFIVRQKEASRYMTVTWIFIGQVKYNRRRTIAEVTQLGYSYHWHHRRFAELDGANAMDL